MHFSNSLMTTTSKLKYVQKYCLVLTSACMLSMGGSALAILCFYTCNVKDFGSSNTSHKFLANERNLHIHCEYIHSSGVYHEVLKMLKPLHDHPQLHNAFLEYCLPPYITQKLTKLLDTV